MFVDISTGCPRITEDLALELIKEIEAQRMQSVGAAIKAIQAQQTQELPCPEQAIANLVSSIERDFEVGPRIGEAVLALWPQLPKTLLGELTAWPQGDNKALPINRRKRRALGKANRTLLHLFAGDSRKEIEKKGSERGFEVLSIGEQEDIMAGQTFKYLLEQAAAGRWDAIWAAPPCGTNTLCRFIQPGPPPLRGREGESRWGLPGLSPVDKKKVQASDEMYLRCLLIMLVAAEGRKRHGKPPTWSLLAENPQDPDEYLEADAQLRTKSQETGGLPSWFATAEYRTAARLLGMEIYRGDQGPYGHPRRKPTGWASTRPLPSLLKGPGVGNDKVNGEGIDPQKSGKGWESKNWAKWASGMIDLLMNQLSGIGGASTKRVEINWTEHIASGHWPPLRQCRTCIMANARHRAHKRISHPSSWTLSLDTVGPFKAAADETERNLRFALVGCLVVPVDKKGRPVLGPAQEQASEEGPKTEPSANLEEDDDNIDLGEALGIRAVDSSEADQEPDVTEEERERAHQQCQQDAQGMSQAELECVVPGLRWKEVHFIEILKRKTPQSIVLGTARILGEIRELGFPVVRCHTDSGTEYINSRFRDFVAKHDMKHTCASPQEPSSNGRVESAIGRIKNLAKVHLHGTEGNPELWPLALRAAVASMKTQSLRSMGFPIPKVVPFGTKVQVLARTWLRRRKQEWHLRAREATVLCPAALVKRGYVVKVGKQLAVVTKLFQGEDPKLKVGVDGIDNPEGGPPTVVVDNQCNEPPLAHSTGPEARITGKSTIPDMTISPNPSRRYRDKAPAPGRVPVACKAQENSQLEEEEDRVAASLAAEPHVRLDRIIQFIKGSSYMKGTVEPQSKKLEGGRHYVFGAFRHGGVVGITNNCKLRPGMAKLLNVIAKALAPNASFTTLALSINGLTPPHKDINNQRPSSSYWIPLVLPTSGGRLWTELKQGAVVSGEPVTMQIQNKQVVAQLHDKEHVVQFDPSAWHGTEPWPSEQQRLVLLLYTVGCMENISPPNEHYLQQLGFGLPEQAKGGDSVVQTKNGIEGTSCGMKVQGAGFDCVGSGERCDEVQFRVGDDGSQESDVLSSGEECDDLEPRQQWCCLCEQRQPVIHGSDCAVCKCSFQLPQTEGSSQNIPKPNKNQKNPKPNKHQKIPKPHKNKPGPKQNLAGVERDPETFRLCVACDDHDLEWICAEGLVNLGKRVELCHGHVFSSGVVVGVTEGPDDGTDEVQKHDSVVVDQVVVDVDAQGKPHEPMGEDPGEGENSEKLAGHSLVGCVELVGDVIEHEGVGDGAMRDASLVDSACDNDEGSVTDLDDMKRRELPLDDREDIAVLKRLEMMYESMNDSVTCVEEVPADQLDVDQFARWLDESQLRIAQACEEDLESWIEGTRPQTEDDWEQRKQIERDWQALEDIRMELTLLCVKRVSEDLSALSEVDTTAQQEVLQTRIIANHEVAKNWEVWEPSATAEISELIENKGALERSTVDYLHDLRARGVTVQEVPSKIIFSIKAPKGRLKARLVACGNYLGKAGESRFSHREAVFTESISIEGLRACLAFSVRRGHDFMTIDVKSAFLNATQLPRDRRLAAEIAQKGGEISAEEAGEVIALIPPRILLTKGIFSARTRLIIRRALYGLDTSPRDWGMRRDCDLQRVVIESDGKKYKLFQSYAEGGLWLVSERDPRRGFEATQQREAISGEIMGWIAVYVDDLMVAAKMELAEAIVQSLRTLWVCSDPEVVSNKCPGVRFLGLDLFWVREGALVLSQQSYIADLCSKYQEELAKFGTPATPMISNFDDELIEPEISAEDLKRTQGLVGELLWASIRTRPDITYAVSRIASRTSKAPKEAFKAGLHVLAYLKGSASHVLTYRREAPQQEPEPFRRPSLHGVLQGYGDASFAPEAQRSMQCVQVFVEGNIIAWQAHRQSFMSVSSCESELVALLDLANYTLAMGYVLDELLQRRAEKEILGDNLASLAIFGGTSSHWRTRHLKIKSRAFHERNHDGELPAVHIAGESNPADLGTKALQPPRHWRLSHQIGLEDIKPLVKKVQATREAGVTLRDCLLAVVLACCLQPARAQPDGSTSSGDGILVVVVFMIVVTAISVWECFRRVVVEGSGCPRRTPRPLPPPNPPAQDPSDEESDEPQPDHEDELVDEPVGIPLGVPIDPPRPRTPEVPVAPPEAALRQRRGLPIYRPEPDYEPPPLPPQPVEPPQLERGAPEQFQGVVLGRYVDDVVLGIPEAALGQADNVGVQGIAPPPEPPHDLQEGRDVGPQPRVRIRDFEEVRQQVLREAAGRRALDLPIQPPLTVNPTWGPSPTQPTLRQAQQNRSAWGGLESSVYHRPPAVYRVDFYQLDLPRGVLIRWHCKARTRLFTPAGTRIPAPVEMRTLTGERRSVVHELTRQFMIDDNFRGERPTRSMQSEWRGRTELRIDVQYLAQLQARAPEAD